MAYSERSIRALLKLRRIAQGRANELAVRLAELDRSRAAIESRIAAIDDAMGSERRLATDNPAISLARLSSFLDGAALKRSQLIASAQAIDAECGHLRAAVAAAQIDIRKLDHVLDRARAAIEQAAARRERAALDEAGRRSHARRRR